MLAIPHTLKEYEELRELFDIEFSNCFSCDHLAE
jgi:hypothetical protein